MDYTEDQDLPRVSLREVVDLCLRFPDEATANGILYTPITLGEGESEVTTPFPNYRNIDTIGIIYKPTGETLQGEDGEYPEMAPVEGWHVNVRLMPDEDSTELAPFVVTPTNPVRVWA